MSGYDVSAIVDSSVIVGLILGDMKTSSQTRYRGAISQHRCAFIELIKQESIARLSQHYKIARAIGLFDTLTSGMVVLEKSDDVVRETKVLREKCKGMKISSRLRSDIAIAATAIVYDCPVITDDRDFQRIRSHEKRLRLITEKSSMGARYLSRGKRRA